MNDTQATDTQAGEITTDIICINCGYNLRGLREGGKCPECGFEIDFSLSDDLTKPTAMEACKRLYLGIRRLRLGILLVTIGLSLKIEFYIGYHFRLHFSCSEISNLCAYICLIPGAVFFILGVNDCCHKFTWIKFGFWRIWICRLTATVGSLALMGFLINRPGLGYSRPGNLIPKVLCELFVSTAIFCIGLCMALLSTHLIRIGKRLQKPRLARWLSHSLASLCISACSFGLMSLAISTYLYSGVSLSFCRMPSYKYSYLPDAVLTPAGLFFYATLTLTLISLIVVTAILWSFEYKLKHIKNDYQRVQNTADA